MLNPVALFRTASSRSSSSSSSRLLLFTSSGSRDEDYESSSDFSEESRAVPVGGHQSTLDRLYAWEKKLYDEVKSGERIHMAYEKKRSLLRKQDVKGEDPSAVEKTRLGISHLQTQLKIAVHSIEAVSRRIEALRDEELQPQLLELLQGLARMWRVMAECHQSQKRTLDQAKLLLAGMASKLDGELRHNHDHHRYSSGAEADPQRLPRSAANLEAALKNWRSCFETWITSQRLYMDALAGWLLRCVGSRADITKFQGSPRRTNDGAFPMVGLCINWARLLDVFRMARVVDGIDFFAAGMGSLYARRQIKENTVHVSAGFADRLHDDDDDDVDDDHDEETMKMVEVGEAEEVFAPAKMAEMAIKVLCAGMSVAVSSLAEFAAASADGYAELAQQWQVLLPPPL